MKTWMTLDIVCDLFAFMCKVCTWIFLFNVLFAAVYMMVTATNTDHMAGKSIIALGFSILSFFMTFFFEGLKKLYEDVEEMKKNK